MPMVKFLSMNKDKEDVDESIRCCSAYGVWAKKVSKREENHSGEKMDTVHII